MKILSYVKSLLPRLNKDQVLEDLRTTSQELTEVAAPTFKHAAEFFRSNKFQSDTVKDLDATFSKKLDRDGIPRQTNMVSEINIRIANLKDNATYVEEQVEACFERDIYAEGLSAKKAMFLRAAEHLSFLSRMSLDILNYVYTVEAMESGVELSEGNMLSPAERRHVEMNVGVYASLLSDYGLPSKKFQELFTKVPEIFVNSHSAAAVAGVFNETDVDPFKAAYASGFTGNPIYHLRLIFTEWQAARYRANKDKKKMLELRLLHLELLKAKKNDPKVEQEIEYTRGRINKIDSYLRDVEASVETEEVVEA